MARRLHPDARRALITAAAAALVAERGFRGLTLTAVAERCDMTLPGLTHYFPRLDDLLLAVIDLRDERDGAAIVGTGPGGRLEPSDLIEAVAASVLADPQGAKLHAVLSTEAIDHGHPAHQHVVERMRTLVAELVTAFEGRISDPELVAGALLAAMDGLQAQWLRDPSFDLAAHWRALAWPLVRAHWIGEEPAR